MRAKSDEELKEDAQQRLFEMLSRKSFLERWEPVAKELQWVANRRPDADQHQKILPDYCYGILELWSRTIFNIYAPITEAFTFKDKEKAMKCTSIEEAKLFMTIDFEAIGKVLEMGERGAMFFENELKEKLKQDGLLDLTPEQKEKVFKYFVGESWAKEKENQFEALYANVPIEEIVKKFISKHEQAKNAVPEWHEKAKEWGPEAVTGYHTGVTKGSTGFLDKNGELTGERKMNLFETYQFLLLAWPEIQDMLAADPPKTRNDLWEWLTPFSYAGWIEIEDLEQLNRLCNTIKLTLKEPGRPSKIK
jgi:hypothetical protein